MSKKVRRLFEGFQPTHYQISLDPNRDTMVLSGTVTVRGKKVGRPSQRFTFHQHGLQITSATIVKHDKKSGQEDIAIARINHQNTLDEVRLHTDTLLYPGEYTVTMEFNGAITRNMEGVYPCFFEHDGKQKQLMATQFESHHAREAFPCIDEPEAKATFDLILTSPIGETAIANTPIREQNEVDGKLVTNFETTPVMSTYLLAFVYGELGYKEAVTKHGVTIRTYATLDNVEFTAFALENAVKSLDFFTDYFGIPYPLAKCDLIALPDFASGAMENWGCITFREHGLFLDPANSSLPTKQYIVSVVAHELAHQWFGNLVTMRWWNDLWLNESFATWMSYLASNELYPEWDVWTQFVVDEQHMAFKADALENTHPIQSVINHPDEIRTIFDAISYEKGGSVLQMLVNYIGHEAFQKGLQKYLKQHLYKNTVADDLWNALEEASSKPVSSFMQSWVATAGFPIVQASIQEHDVQLTQKQFLVNPLEETDPERLWQIPLNDGDAAHDIFDTHELTLSVKHPEIYRLNLERSAFYRVVYNQEHVTRLAKLVEADKLSPLDRLGLLSDAFEGAKAGYSATSDALLLLESYKAESNSFVWDVMAGNLGAIRATMNDEDLREAMKPYAQKLVAAQLERLGWDSKESDTHFDKLLRPLIISIAAVSDQQNIVDEALRRFNAMTKPEDIDPDLRGIVYTTAARLGDEKTFEKLLQMHNESSSSEERVTLAAALTGFKQPELIERALSLIATDIVRLQDVMYWVAYSFSNRFARQATWEWLKENWEWFKKNLGADLAFYRMPIYAARNFSDDAFLEDYKQFFESVMSPALERSVRQGIETIQWQSEWRKRDLEAIKAYFAQ